MQRNLVYRPFLLVFISFSLFSNTAKSEVKVSAASLADKEIITQIALGGWHSAAVSESGQFYTWGYNGNGQLGDDTGSNRNVPLSISGHLDLNAGETIAQTSFGYNHSSILTSNSRLLTWGRNDYGQLGDNTVVAKSSPVDITSQFSLLSGETIAQISLGSNHSSALTSANRLFIWGYNGSGQIGNNSTTNCVIPTDITSYFNLNVGESIEKVVLGEFHSSAFTSTNRVFFWGMNTIGQLGDGTTTNRPVPTDITSNLNLHVEESIVDLSLGTGDSSILTSESRVFTWGMNINGQLGDGTTIGKLVPTEITSNFNLDSGEKITKIILRGGSSSAFTSASRVFTWGENTYGQLGDGTILSKASPLDITSKFVLVSGETIADVALGFGHSALLTSDGRLFMWGRNTYGQLGNGVETDVNTPTLLEIVPSSNDVDTPTNANWAWWFLLLLIIPIGYFVYRYRKNIARIFKKKDNLKQ